MKWNICKDHCFDGAWFNSFSKLKYNKNVLVTIFLCMFLYFKDYLTKYFYTISLLAREVPFITQAHSLHRLSFINYNIFAKYIYKGRWAIYGCRQYYALRTHFKRMTSQTGLYNFKMASDKDNIIMLNDMQIY